MPTITTTRYAAGSPYYYAVGTVQHTHIWNENGTCEGEDERPIYACDCGAQKDCDGTIEGGDDDTHLYITIESTRLGAFMAVAWQLAVAGYIKK